MATNVHNGYLNTLTWAPSSSKHFYSLLILLINSRIETARDALTARELLRGVLPAP